MMTRSMKEEEVSQLVEKFKLAKAAFLIDFKGMKVSQVTELRKKLHPVEAEMRVVRNTLARRAIKSFPGVDTALNPSLRGTNAIVFSYGDVSASAKALSLFAKDVELLQLKTGVMDDQVLDQKRIEFISTLPSKEVLKAQLLGVFQAPASRLARTLNEVSSQLVRVLAAKKE